MILLPPAPFRDCIRASSLQRCKRHSFASRLVMAGVDLCIALQLMREWRNWQTHQT